ncbi:unnamed protein product, partial [marine sediment metagenome]
TASINAYLTALDSAEVEYIDGLGFVANGIMHTDDGGIAEQMINKTGAASVKGNMVSADHTVENAVHLSEQEEPDPIGIVYEAGVADGELCWVTITGKAQVYFIGNSVVGDFARGFVAADSGYVAGQALSEEVPSTPFATDKHFYEIGHVLESRTGAGLALVNLHFN